MKPKDDNYEKEIEKKIRYFSNNLKDRDYCCVSHVALEDLAKAISAIPCPKCRELEEECIKNDGYRVMKLEESISDKDKKISELKAETEILDSDRKSAYMRLGEVKAKLRAVDR